MRPPMITHLFLLFCLFHQLVFALPTVHPASCHSEERSALLQFKESFTVNRYGSPVPYAYPKVASWKLEGNGSDCCSWDGVECDVDTGHVVGLDLSASCLYGSINSSSSLFHLVHLQQLNLAFSDFNGSQIPSAFGNLSDLTQLEPSNFLFFGQIPSEISKLSKISYLDLSSNYSQSSEKLLELKMPDLRSLAQNLSNKKYLHLGSVDISSPIPDILANLSSLRSLYLPNCGLYGKFPMAVFRLPNIQYLELPYNPQLNGHLPEFIWGGKLKYLELPNTSFSGQLPASIGNLHSLESVDIGDCKFSGVIPFSLGNLSKLVALELRANSFSGQIPSSMANLTQINYVSLFFNNFSEGCCGN